MRPVVYREIDEHDEFDLETGNKKYVKDSEDQEFRVDMQYLARSQKVKRYRFDNVASAARKTGVNSDLLQGVCEDGGGFLGGSWFSFAKSGGGPPKKSKEFFLPQKFEISGLNLLKGEMRTEKWWKRLIELVCKETKTAVLAFPSTEYAAHALGLRLHQVRRACNSYGTGQQYDFRVSGSKLASSALRKT